MAAYAITTVFLEEAIYELAFSSYGGLTVFYVFFVAGKRRFSGL
jgi:hypothetical protein